MADLEPPATAPVPRRVFHGLLIHSLGPRQTEYIHDGLLGVNAAGVIAFVEKGVPEDQLPARLEALGWQSARVVRLQRGEFLMASFIDTHTHACQYPNLGYGQEHQLLDWLKQVTFPREKKFESVAYARQTYESVVTRVINSGTTTCCYYGTLHKEATEILASICHKKGQRAFIGKVCMDRNAVPEYQEKSAAISINDTKEFIRHVRSKCCAPTIEPDFLSAQGEFLSEPRSPVSISSHGSSLMVTQAEDTALVKPIATPRFAISCSDTLLASIGALVTRDQSLAIQTHLSENETEVEFTKELFPFAKNYTAVYDHFGLLRHNTILAHCVHLEESEIELLAKRKAGISHCPTSNVNLRSGASRVGGLLDRGIKVGLGTDVSGGFGLGILSAIRDASVVSKTLSFQARLQQRPASPEGSRSGSRTRSVTPKRVANQTSATSLRFADSHLGLDTLYFLATLGGAQVCCLDERIGNLLPGKEFDALLIQTGQKSPDDVKPRLGPENNYDDILDSLPDPYPEGLNPALFIEPDDEIEVVFEKFLFCGDDRNIGTVFVRGKAIGGARPLE